MSASGYFYGGVALVGLGLLASQPRTGESMKAEPASAVAARIPAPAPGPVRTREKPQALNAFGAITLVRAPDSHFYAEAELNGAPIRFLVDTGATSVILTAEDARRAGIGAGDYSARAVGVGGEVRLMPAEIARFSLGPLVLDNVSVMVAEEGALPISLLGQSFLSQAGTVTIEEDRLTLR